LRMGGERERKQNGGDKGFHKFSGLLRG